MKKQYEDTDFDSSFKKLNADLMWKTKEKQELKKRIFTDIEKLESQKRNKNPLLSTRIKKVSLIRKLTYSGIALILLLGLFIGSTFVSPAMAQIAAKIMPLKITSSFSANNIDENLHQKLIKLIENQGYKVDSIGSIYDPFTIDISLILSNEQLKEAKEQLTPLVKETLSNHGIDDYNLLIRNIKSSERSTSLSKRDVKRKVMYDSLRQIVFDVFTKYGYEEEANYELAGLDQTWFSNILLLDMPDHIKERNSIISDIQQEIEAQNLDIKDIKVHSFNLEHQKQDSRWSYIASDLHESLAGKSTYKVTGLSYQVKKGHAYIDLGTNWTTTPSTQLLDELENAIKTYLALPDVKKQMQGNPYTIKLLMENGEDFMVISPEG
ncbi:hypothetical protein [Peribacillus butanolivorans]|uniref:hypothetical protein n=1 Tax=Peribacillus butanolivorans TaxID=421767 RepID=UPI0035DC30D0